VREVEGITMPRLGSSQERPWSKHREPHVRNVEAVGSNPITSTRKSPGHGAEGGLPEAQRMPMSATLVLQGR
jgi:hypothetical protein